MSIDLEAIKARCEAATKGPWSITTRCDGSVQSGREITANPEYPKLVATTKRGTHERQDAKFIAHAREDVPALVDEVERLTVGIKEIGAVCAKRHDKNKELEKQLAAAPCWCNDCFFGRKSDEGICCENPDSERAGEWTGTYDSCQYCKRRGP